MKPDLFQSPDYYNLDDLLNEEHKLVRDSARAWVKREVSHYRRICSKGRIPKQIIKGLGEIGGFGPYIPGIWWSWFRPNIIRINHARN
jgi:glutaryl-CoA dehydrogenase